MFGYITAHSSRGSWPRNRTLASRVRFLCLLLISAPASCGARTALPGLGVDRANPLGPNPTEPADAATPLACPTGMAAIGAGDFVLGDSKLPAHVNPYCLDIDLTSGNAYDECVAAGVCTVTVEPYVIEPCWLDKGVTRPGAHPVVCVNQTQATGYCAWRGKRLPTDAEMEWAARNGDAATQYAWGNREPLATDEPELLCWSARIKRLEPCDVGAFPAGANLAGVQDLAGNVRVWTTTISDKDPSSFLLRSSKFDANDKYYEKAVYRAWRPPGGDGDIDIGVRCAADARR